MSETNYNEATVAGTSWQRVYSVRVSNDFCMTPPEQRTPDQMPKLTLYEEKIALLDGEIHRKHIGEFNITFDPTNETHLTLYGILNGMYVEQRVIRDTPPVVEEPEETPEV